MKFPEVKQLDYAGVAQKIQKYWEDEKVFEQSISVREGNPNFTFFEGPPSANGTPGIHHVMARTIKDIFCRYQTMKGFQVNRKGGWDTHGLPVELQVEKELGITKEDIGKKVTVEQYNQKCRETVMRYTKEWNDLTRQMGYWVDLENPYITYKNEYIESCWHLLKKFFDKDLLYKGYTIQPYSPAAGTGLSSHELNQPGCYKDVKDTSIVAQFKVKRNAKSEKLFQNLGEAKALSHRELLNAINSPDITDTVSGTVWNEVFILAWTTTPWTLPSNAALAVGEKITYLKVKTFNPYTFKPIVIILAKDLIAKYFHEKSKEIDINSYKPGDKVIPYEILEEYKGSELLDIEYEQLMPYVQPESKAFKVIAGDFVSTEDGTGVVHIAPTFGADDYRVAKTAGIPPIMVKDADGNEMPLVDKQGRFVKEVTDYALMYVKNYSGADETDPNYKSTDVLISIQLKTDNKAFKVEKYEHSYPHCWRTDKPILYYPLESWFIKTTAMKDRLVELNKTINWKPESTGTGRFGNWLENLVDWNLSRSRFWGTPLPVWVSEDGKEIKCIGTVEELMHEIYKSFQYNVMTEEMLENAFPNFDYKKYFYELEIHKVNTFDLDQIDLHRPYIDHIILVSDTGKPMLREKDLIDVWFDSGAMPFAQWNYTGKEGSLPFQSKSHKATFPADFISEGVDQTRGWFFTLHAISGMLFDSIAFKNVVSTGLVLDKNGNKMSKRVGNVVNPFETLDKYGPDATRWYMVENAQPWDNLKFNLEGITEVQRRFFSTLHNTYNFFAMYANLDQFDYTKDIVPVSERTESDRWIISKLHTTIKITDEAFADYDPTLAARTVQAFVCDDLSNWYVRLNRKRFWKGEMSNDKRAAYQTLHTCLLTVAHLMAPIAPFYADELYDNLTGDGSQKRKSIHLALMPKFDAQLCDLDLEQQMDLAQQICSMVHSLRKLNSLRVRLPLSKIMIPILSAKTKEQIIKMEELIKSEVNIKKIDYIDDASGLLKKKAKPNFKKLGKELGPKIKEIGAIVALFTTEDISEIEANGKKIIFADGSNLNLSSEDLEIQTEDIPGWATVSNSSLTVALDITLTEDLKQEGIARDFVNRVQNQRKDMGLEVQDKIKIKIENKDALIDQALISNKEYICIETQALELTFEPRLTSFVEIDMDEFILNVSIEK